MNGPKFSEFWLRTVCTPEATGVETDEVVIRAHPKFLPINALYGDLKYGLPTIRRSSGPLPEVRFWTDADWVARMPLFRQLS